MVIVKLMRLLSSGPKGELYHLTVMITKCEAMVITHPSNILTRIPNHHLMAITCRGLRQWTARGVILTPQSHLWRKFRPFQDMILIDTRLGRSTIMASLPQDLKTIVITIFRLEPMPQFTILHHLQTYTKLKFITLTLCSQDIRQMHLLLNIPNNLHALSQQVDRSPCKMDSTALLLSPTIGTAPRMATCK